MQDDLTPVEMFLDKTTSQVRWTSSISIFFITAILTFFTFTGTLLILLSLIPLALSVFFSWKVSHSAFVLHRAIFYARVDSKEKPEIMGPASDLECFWKWHYYTFIIGFFTFIVLILISVIAQNMDLPCTIIDELVKYR